MKIIRNQNLLSNRISVLFVFGLFTFVSCFSENKNPESGKLISSKVEDNIYHISSKQFQTSKMELGNFEKIVFHEEIRTNGMFDVPPAHRAAVSAYFGGTVKNFDIHVGDKVKKGQVLFILENPEYVQLQQDYLEVKAQLSYLKSDYERQKELALENFSSQKTYLKAESDYVVTKVKFEALHKKLTLMNIPPNSLSLDNIQTTLTVTAPINGFITELNITRGLYLGPSQTAVTIVDMEQVYLDLNIFQKDFYKIAIGQIIQFSLHEDLIKYKAIVHSINKSVDPDTRTIGVHCKIVDEKLTRRFYPGMYAEAIIQTNSELKISLPASAIVEADDKSYILVLSNSSSEAYTFEKREVTTGSSSDGFVEIRNFQEFNENIEILVNGAFNLLME